MAKRPIKTQKRLILIKRYILSAVHLTQMGITDVYLVTDLEDTAQALYRKMGYQFAGSFKQYQKIY